MSKNDCDDEERSAGGFLHAFKCGCIGICFSNPRRVKHIPVMTLVSCAHNGGHPHLDFVMHPRENYAGPCEDPTTLVTALNQLLDDGVKYHAMRESIMNPSRT